MALVDDQVPQGRTRIQVREAHGSEGPPLAGGSPSVCLSSSSSRRQATPCAGPDSHAKPGALLGLHPVKGRPSAAGRQAPLLRTGDAVGERPVAPGLDECADCGHVLGVYQQPLNGFLVPFRVAVVVAACFLSCSWPPMACGNVERCSDWRP